MSYIQKNENKLTCNHPKVSKIHEWGGVGLDPFSTAYRFITLTMSDGEEKIFQDYGEGKAEEEAEKYLQTECKVV
jgi:hypothetical protein